MELSSSFYQRDTKKVAKDLLGKILVRKTREGITSGITVETEAYYGPNDPASRAANGKTKISKPMWSKPGTILVYMVHANWLFNIVTEEKDVPGAVLFRALEPVKGVKNMKQRRNKTDIQELCSGPGKLTQALGITQEENEKKITTSPNLLIKTPKKPRKFEIGTSHRIGVTEDMQEELRFYIQDSSFLSR